MTQHIKRYQLSEDWIFRVKMSIYSQSPFWDFTYFGIFQYLILKLLEEFGAKTMFSCKNGPLHCQNINALYRFPNCKSLFLKINFTPICYDIFNEIGVSQECNVRFKKKCTKIELKEQPFSKYIAKSQCWSSDLTGLFW